MIWEVVPYWSRGMVAVETKPAPGSGVKKQSAAQLHAMHML